MPTRLWGQFIRRPGDLKVHAVTSERRGAGRYNRGLNGWPGMLVMRYFRGRGCQVAFIRRNNPENLSMPLEIKKIFMDEEGFEGNALIFSELTRQLAQVVAENGTRFENDFVRKCEE